MSAYLLLPYYLVNSPIVSSANRETGPVPEWTKYGTATLGYWLSLADFRDLCYWSEVRGC